MLSARRRTAAQQGRLPQVPSTLLPDRTDSSPVPAASPGLGQFASRQSLLDKDSILRPFQGMSDDDKRRKLAARIEQLRRQAPGSLRAHTQLVHRTDEDEPQVAYRHHAEWCRILE